MANRDYIIAALLLLFTAIHFVFAEEQPRFTMVGVRSGLVLREGPRSISKALALVPYGTLLEVRDTDHYSIVNGVNGRWVSARFGGKQGFLFGGYLLPGNWPAVDLAVAEAFGRSLQEVPDVEIARYSLAAHEVKRDDELIIVMVGKSFTSGPQSFCATQAFVFIAGSTSVRLAATLDECSLEPIDADGDGKLDLLGYSGACCGGTYTLYFRTPDNKSFVKGASVDGFDIQLVGKKSCDGLKIKTGSPAIPGRPDESKRYKFDCNTRRFVVE